jgi:acetate kinase
MKKEMKILVINSGSSSIKFQLIGMPAEEVIASGVVERIGLDESKIKFRSHQGEFEQEGAIGNHEAGLQMIAELLLDPKQGVIEDASGIDAVGHRVVHGGSSFSETVRIDEEVKAKIQELFSLAPLHNPHNFKGVEVAERIFPEAVQVAVFDTAFHQTIPEVAYRYAIPEEIYREHQLRTYGFHGTSHKYVSEKAAKYLNGGAGKMITVHLGNGCSITAIKDGKSVEHSLGFGPMNGLIMGTRSGDIDQSVIFHLVDELGYEVGEVKRLLQEKSGMLGLTGYSDLREIETAASQGDESCILALRMNAYRVKKYIGAYTAAMNGLDALVFTAGIGENSDLLRKLICSDMEFFGISLDQEKNRVREQSIREIQSEGAGVSILVVPTNEEIEIAKQSFRLLSSRDPSQ